jgi:hypothetical protein
MRLLAVCLALAGCSSSGSSIASDLSSSTDLATVTWTNYAQAFFQHYCVSCHNPTGTASVQDFNQYAVVKSNAALIRCGVAPMGMLPSGCSGNPAAGQFPIDPGPKPSDAERLAIVAWIDSGAPL